MTRVLFCAAVVLGLPRPDYGPCRLLKETGDER
jgi:hypothetical protein